jgi:hypothetical protein
MDFTLSGFSGVAVSGSIKVPKGKKTVVMGATDSSLQGSEHPSCCNPKPTQSSGRVHLPLSSDPYQNNELGERRLSMDSTRHESGHTAKRSTAGSMCQPKIGEYLGDLSVDCCCLNYPSNLIVIRGDQANSGQLSHVSPQSVCTPQNAIKSKLGDKALAHFSDYKGQGQNVSSWGIDPPTLERRFLEEQQPLIHQSIKSPRTLGTCPEYHDILLSTDARPSKPREGRSESECGKCWNHIEANRIPYFGPIQHQSTVAP